MGRPINVLHLLGTAQPDGSGIARIVAALAQGLDPQRFKLHAWFLKSDGPLVAELCDAGADARYVGWENGLRNPVGALRLWRQLRREQEFDLVHQHSGARAIRQLIRFGSSAKIIVHSHGQILEERERRRDPLVVLGADKIIAVSQSIAHQLQAQRTDVVYSGVAPSEQPNRKTSNDSTVVIGTACRLIEAKGVRDLISAFAALHKEQPMIRLEIAGAGPEERTLIRAAQDQGVAEVVRFLGWRNDLRRILRTWDIFALPSYDEGLPVAILEAMAEGLPVVATNVGGIPELVEHAHTGYLVDPGNVDALLVGLRRLARNSDLRCQLGDAGSRRIRANFSVEKMVREIALIYDSMTRKK